MPTIGARGSVGIETMGWDGDESSGAFDMSAPAGWFHAMWIASVVIILVMLWLL
jgi:hypothetical protein